VYEGEEGKVEGRYEEERRHVILPKIRHRGVSSLFLSTHFPSSQSASLKRKYKNGNCLKYPKNCEGKFAFGSLILFTDQGGNKCEEKKTKWLTLGISVYQQ
jgi:hypothetical protein